MSIIIFKFILDTSKILEMYLLNNKHHEKLQYPLGHAKISMMVNIDITINTGYFYPPVRLMTYQTIKIYHSLIATQ